jgi:hypothetical protein
MKHLSEYNEVEDHFRQSQYGAVLAEKVRYDKYRDPSVSTTEWVALLGRDVSNLEHLSLTRGIALGFVRHSQEHQPDLLDAEDAVVLPLIGSLHDWGEAITGDISYGDKSASDDATEVHALSVVADELYPDVAPTYLEQAKEVVFDHAGESKRGEIFFAIECLGYMRTALNAMDISLDESADPVHQPGLQWLYTDVVTNITEKMIAQAGKFDAVHAALLANVPRIDRAFDLIDSHPHVFNNYPEDKRIPKQEAFLFALDAWEKFKQSDASVY